MVTHSRLHPVSPENSYWKHRTTTTMNCHNIQTLLSRSSQYSYGITRSWRSWKWGDVKWTINAPKRLLKGSLETQHWRYSISLTTGLAQSQWRGGRKSSVSAASNLLTWATTPSMMKVLNASLKASKKVPTSLRIWSGKTPRWPQPTAVSPLLWNI